MPDVMSALLLVGLDESTQAYLRRDIMISLEEIGRAFPHDIETSLAIVSDFLICYSREALTNSNRSRQLVSKSRGSLRP